MTLATLIRIHEPIRPPVNPRPSWKATLSMAFRPFYLLAALQAAVFIFAWAFGFGGTQALPGMLWHAHEMIWGYAGAVIVGFLLTAVATWTGQAPVRGLLLAQLAGVWLLARVVLLALPDTNLPGGALSALFFIIAAFFMAIPVIRTRNKRNYIVPVLLLAMATADLVFHLSVAGLLSLDPRHMLHVGLLLVATVIFFMGMRVISFFTSRALQTPQVVNGPAVTFVAVGATLCLALAVALEAPAALSAVLGLAAGVTNLVQLLRWWQKGVTRNPLLWVLFAGYACAAVGVGLYGLSAALWPQAMSAALHSIAVGGVGLLTVGMMVRTALGHTGRPLSLPPPMGGAFWLILGATVLRLFAAWPSPLSPWAIMASGVCFSAGMALFVFRFGPWLLKPRADGMP